MAFQFYSRAVLLSIISSIHHIPAMDNATWRVLKSNGIARVITRRGCRAGSSKQRRINTVSSNGKYNPNFGKCWQSQADYESKTQSIEKNPSWSMQIFPSKSPWEFEQQSTYHQRNVINLISIQPNRQKESINSSTQFAVPKFLFTNICSLTKTKRKVRAAVALEADLNNYDIDMCIVSETHLKPDIPDSVVNIPGYEIHRRDRNWSGKDMRNKGGIAIYTRSNLIVTNAYRSSSYELMYLKLRLPSGHNMLVCGLYHPPKFNYKESDLMDYIIEILDKELDLDPHMTFVLGGDLNQLNLTTLETISGLKPLVNFATRGNSCLDNCLTNREDLFNECYPVQMLMKTDHKGVILPAGSKLKPIRQNIKIRDVRKHRKRDFYIAINDVNFDDVMNFNDINGAVNTLENTILVLMDRYMPIRTVRMSSRDPGWMSPLLKSLLREKSRVSRNNKDRLNSINERIIEVISENRRIRPKKVGSRDWWKHVDATSQRLRSTTNVSLSYEELNELNDYFCSLCTDNAYTEPPNVDIDINDDIPELSEWQVWNSLIHLKNTATGPDRIPFWVWKDHAEILAPVVRKIWNLSLSSQTWPTSWKRSTIKPLPKVDIPKSYKDYRGINITPVIARAFERIVYHNYVKNTIEKNLSVSQFAYRQGGNCSNALLSIQNEVCKHLDDKHCKAVRLFAMDFSKAFDSVKHDLLARKLRSLGLNTYLNNWYLSFLNGREQRVVWSTTLCDWKAVNKGTTQGSVSGPYLFIIFLNDLNVTFDNQPCIIKYADDSTLISPIYNSCDLSNDIVDQFLSWTDNNSMSCNPSKCKELVICKKGVDGSSFSTIAGIPKCDHLTILGVTFESNCRFGIHVRNKLIKANNCLHILRCLRKEGYNQHEIDHLFTNLVLSNLTYCLSVYGSSEPELTSVQAFIKRCHKRKYISNALDIRKLLETQDRCIFSNIRSDQNHPLRHLLPVSKETSYNLRRESYIMPKVNTNRYLNVFSNRLIFKYN